MIKHACLFFLAILMTGCAVNRTYMEELPMSKISADQSMDMRGKTITTYILYHAVKKLENMKEGEVLEISTDKYEAIENDIKSWSRMTGHELIDVDTGNDYQRFYVRKLEAAITPKEFAIIISDPSLEDLLTPLGLSLAAALRGDNVHIIFQGPAVRVLKRGYNASLKGMARPFSVFARKGMSAIGHIPPQDKLRQLKELGADFYLCGPSMQHFGVKKSELIFDDVTVAEYVTFMEIISKADVHFFLQ